MRLIVIFTPTRLGKSHGKLLLTYDSGESLWVTLEGYAKEANIYLEKGSLNFDETFIGLTRQKTLTLTNNSKYLVNFEWKLYVSAKEEMAHLDKLKESMHHMKENEATKSNKLQHLDIIDAGGHSKVYERIYADEVSELEAGSLLLFQNPYFRIVPLRGEVWPNAKFTFTIFFAPTRVGRYNSAGYLYVTGRGQRVRLLLNGLAMGPMIELNMTRLDVNKLYMCSVHQYEIVARNKGDIPGGVKFVSQELDFGGTMSCEPELILLEPGKCGRFVITFSSREQGTFIEEILFNIEESREVLRVIFTGEIDCPYLSFEECEIDFGTVPIGDPIRKQIVMKNSSLVPISYKLSVQGDGDIPSVTCAEYASLPIRCGLSKRPREFDYCQRSGSVPPNSCFHMELTLTANIVRHRSTALIIKMWDSHKHTISLPLSYAVSVPKVSCVPPEINIRFCFLNYPYHRTVILHNETPLSGYVEIDASSVSMHCCNAPRGYCF
ncbi:hydrocephalus-inducing protein-like [Photinus pyralis]|uniref:hydrocephalus-inducing protein-like n=1 Tax=Photinus pyralis TaxID=7054 RepID=UPI0012670E06|nr:hydrocephalus-inducing protein-like [Photinus pyralis]